MSEFTGEPMTDGEFREMARLLAKYASTEMDQWGLWIIETIYGPVFVDIGPEMPKDGRSAAAYNTIWPSPPHLRQLPDTQPQWVVFRHRDGDRVEVDRFASRKEAEDRLLALERGGGSYWIAARAESGAP